MKNKIIARYRIDYKDGFTQEKTLISHKDFEDIYCVNSTKIDILDDDLRILKRKGKNYEHLYKEIEKIKSENVFLFGKNLFTTESPLFKSIESGKLELLPQQGGSIMIELTKLD